MFICLECGNVLTDEEQHYYAGNCENCERAWHDRIQAWRAGGDEPELEKMYSGKPEMLQ